MEVLGRITHQAHLDPNSLCLGSLWESTGTFEGNKSLHCGLLRKYKSSYKFGEFTIKLMHFLFISTPDSAEAQFKLHVLVFKTI